MLPQLVAAAMLMQQGFGVICQRDFKSLIALQDLLNGQPFVANNALGHHQSEWYKDYFLE